MYVSGCNRNHSPFKCSHAIQLAFSNSDREKRKRLSNKFRTRCSICLMWMEDDAFIGKWIHFQMVFKWEIHHLIWAMGESDWKNTMLFGYSEPTVDWPIKEFYCLIQVTGKKQQATVSHADQTLFSMSKWKLISIKIYISHIFLSPFLTDGWSDFCYFFLLSKWCIY